MCVGLAGERSLGTRLCGTSRGAESGNEVVWD